MNSDARVMEFFRSPLSRVESDAMVDGIEKHFRVTREIRSIEVDVLTAPRGIDARETYADDRSFGGGSFSFVTSSLGGPPAVPEGFILGDIMDLHAVAPEPESPGGDARAAMNLFLHGIGPDDAKRKPPIKTDDALRNEPSELVDMFRTLRQFNLALWKRVSSADLERTGEHNERGPESLSVMLRMMAGHDLSHLHQIARYIQAMRQRE